MQCKGCKKNLTTHKSRFDWLVSRGYSTKDAAASVLYDPMRSGPSRQCCVVNLETNYDSNQKLYERAVNKAILKEDVDEVKIINAYRMATNQPVTTASEIIEGSEVGRTQRLEYAYRSALNLARATGNAEIINRVEFIHNNPDKITNPREAVKIYVADPTNTIPGQFILKDSDFENPGMLAPSAAGRFQGASTGFIIDNIAKIPLRISAAENWGTVQPMALWSGNIKIIPVYRDKDGTIKPGLIYMKTVQTESAGRDILISEFSDEIAGLLGSEVQEYVVGTINEQPVHIIHLLKPSLAN